MTDSLDPRVNKNVLVADIFSTACEGGINYWCDVNAYRWSDGAGQSDLTGFRAVIVDEDGTEHVIDRSVILKGLRLATDKAVTDKHPGVYALRDTGLAYRYGGERLEDLDYDADTADAIVQLGLFGEIIYG